MEPSGSQHLTFANAASDEVPQVTQSLVQFVPLFRDYGSPVTVVLVYQKGKWLKKVFLGQPGHSSTPSHAGTIAGQATNHSTVPQALLIGDQGQRDSICGQTIFCVGSLMKQVIVAVFFILSDAGKLPGIDLETPAHSAYNSTLEPDEVPKIDASSRVPEVGEVMHHHHGYPPANREMFSPCAEFVATDDELITIIGRLTSEEAKHEMENKSNNSSGFAYGNLNIGVLAKIMVRRLNKPLYQILHDELFQPLEMTRTYVHGHRPDTIPENDTNTARGFRWSEDKQQFFAAPDHDLHDSVFAQAAVGLWSCADDMAKFWRALSEARDGDDSYCVKQEAAEAFFKVRVFTDKDEPWFCPAGYARYYPQQSLVRDSLNRAFQKDDQPSHPRLAKLRTSLGGKGKSYLIFNKGGTADASTSTAYSCLEKDFFAIALCNSTSFIDLGEPFARSILDEVLFERSPADTVFETIAQANFARERYLQIEKEGLEHDAWPADLANLAPFYGKYLNSTNRRTLEITGNEAVIRRGGDELVRERVGAQGPYIRLFPKSQGLCAERLADWRDLTFKLQKERTRTLLLGNAGAEEYVKL